MIVLSIAISGCSFNIPQVNCSLGKKKEKIVYKTKYIKTKKRTHTKFRKMKICKITNIKIYKNNEKFFLVDRQEMRKCFKIYKRNSSIIREYEETL